MTPRPESLAAVAVRAIDPIAFEYELADFLHEFARRGEDSMLTEKPALMRDRYPRGAVYDAYLAAVAETFASQLGCPSPAWTRDPDRILHEPWFANSGRHMRALLLVESPAPFRARNLFVSANALSVA